MSNAEPKAASSATTHYASSKVQHALAFCNYSASASRQDITITDKAL